MKVEMKKVHIALTGLTLTIILLSFNRLTSVTSVYLQPYDFLRLLDFNAMIPLPLLTVIFYYILKRNIAENSTKKTKYFTFLGILFISGVFLFGAGSGDHEVTNLSEVLD